jgi:hypothetical protein
VSRPTDYSDRLAAEICERIAAGEGLVSICSAAEMPHRATVHRWLSGEVAGASTAFRDRYVEARALQADAYAERVLTEMEVPLPEDLGQARIELGRRKELVRSLQWAAGRLSPAKWSLEPKPEQHRSISFHWRSGDVTE